MSSKRQSIPIAVIHEGEAFYLPYVLSQLQISSPSSPVFLIADQKALRCAPQGVQKIDIREYSHSADHFSALYKDQHRNFNSFQFEDRCFRRTFILADFLKANNHNASWHIDSDNMIYTDLDQEYRNIPHSCGFAASGLSPHNFFWTLESILDYNRYTLQCITPGTAEYSQVEAIWEDYRKAHTVGGICDMTFLQRYTEQNAQYFHSLENSTHGDWNHSLCTAFPHLDHSRLFFHVPGCRKENGKIFFDGRNMLNVHCQGFTKRFIPFFYTGPDKKALFFKTLRFMPQRIVSYLYHDILKF